HFTRYRFRQFMQHHTETLRLISANNGFFGEAILVFILAGLFSNSYLTNLLITGQFPLFPLLFCCSVVIFQWCLMCGFLLLADYYGKRIHSCSKLLLPHSATGTFRRDKVGSLVKLDSYVAKYHTSKRYGITYVWDGLITIQSFL